MVSFLGFYTTWSILIGIGSLVALSFDLKNDYISPTQNNCNVNISQLSYNLYQLMIFVLSLQIVKTIFQVINYNVTKDNETSCKGKILIFIISFLLAFQIFGLICMIIKFNNENSCFKFFQDKNNNQIPLISSFVAMCVLLIIELIIIIIEFILMCCCSHGSYQGYYKVN
jgi:hypothetical protein